MDRFFLAALTLAVAFAASTEVAFREGEFAGSDAKPVAVVAPEHLASDAAVVAAQTGQSAAEPRISTESDRVAL